MSLHGDGPGRNCLLLYVLVGAGGVGSSGCLGAVGVAKNGCLVTCGLVYGDVFIVIRINTTLVRLPKHTVLVRTASA